MTIIPAKEAYFKDKLSSCNNKNVYQIIGTLLNENVQHLPFLDFASKKEVKVARELLGALETTVSEWIQLTTVTFNFV